jgi:hypothetical protein
MRDASRVFRWFVVWVHERVVGVRTGADGGSANSRDSEQDVLIHAKVNKYIYGVLLLVSPLPTEGR